MAENDPVERAVRLIKAGEKQEARAVLETALKQDSDNARAWASMYHVARDNQEATNALQQVLRLRPGNEWALEHLNRLKRDAAPVPSEPTPAPVVHTPGSSDALIAAAQLKDFTSSAVLTFFLYFLFFIPGLVFNVMYLNEAARVRKIAGRKPTGMGCLQLMLVANLVAFAITVIILCVLPVFGLALVGQS